MAHDSAAVFGPGLPTLVDLKNYLREEKPLYFQALEGYLRNAANIINSLTARLEKSEREAHESDGAIPPSGDASGEIPEQEGLLHEEEEGPMPALVQDDKDEEMAEVRMAPVIVRERRRIETREIALRSRTIRVPMIHVEGRKRTRTSPESFHLPEVEGLPAKYRKLMVEPVNDPYRVARNVEGSTEIECGMCPKKFGTLKGWRIHAAKMHAHNGFCHKCGHFIKMPDGCSIEVTAARMELHRAEWCPKAAKAVMDERATKRRRLELADRLEEAANFYIPNRCQ